jgi:hypothetical protein
MDPQDHRTQTDRRESAGQGKTWLVMKGSAVRIRASALSGNARALPAAGVPTAQRDRRWWPVDVKVEPFELFTLRAKLTTPGEPWDVAWSTLWAAYPDPAGLLLPLLRGTEYEARANAANRVTGTAARAKAWAELEADFMRNDPPVAVYADVTYRALVSRRFGCWSGAPGLHAYRIEENELDLGAVCKK